MKNFTKIQRIELFSEVFDNNTMPSVIEGISCFGQKEILNTNVNKQGEMGSEKVYSMRLVPNYMALKLHLDQTFKVKKILQENWGYSILLKDFSSVDQYINEQFKANFRKLVKRYVTRLESSFEINYRFIHGNIARQEYHSIMEALKGMIIRRFGQKGENSNDLYKWPELMSKTFDQINTGKASLFIIYHEELPIEISLNYHFGTILFSAVSSYNIDYAKFGLGHVEIYKQLEWCISNGYVCFEMGVGGMDYKRRWSNNIYQFEHHVIYGKNSIEERLLGNIETMRISLKEYLKSKKLNLISFKIKSLALLASKSKNTKYRITYLDDAIPKTGFTIIDSQNVKNNSLKKHIYDFLYLNRERLKEVEILEIEKGKYYIVKGINKSMELKKVG
ncbi:GNAT family N-acetyltransferase [Flagellimonas sp. HMM57]|uniref:GNAT family N-acetyltransferase n=1 Tax=unclassified Flagellimonas TaxID=2644544 RepID=UPI0013D64D87|nr:MULTISPECIES: GNAT family N-acetyltransferase [unclassified Flagellimonas]UII76136.1 GNAT family N-acetyltransferase [Flagellimonas sp. HMM57]